MLDLNHLPILVTYLRRIGMPEDYLDFAAVVEFTRFKMRDVLSNNNHKSCTVSNRGVESEPKASSLNYMANKSLIGMDKNGTFWLDNERYFDKENWRRNIFIRRKSFSSIERER